MTKAERLAAQIQRDKEALAPARKRAAAGRDPQGDEQTALPGRRAGR